MSADDIDEQRSSSKVEAIPVARDWAWVSAPSVADTDLLGWPQSRRDVAAKLDELRSCEPSSGRERPRR